MSKVIQFELSDSGIDKAIREVDKYKQEISRKTLILRDRVAERLKEMVEQGFNSPYQDDIIKGELSSFSDVSVTIVEHGSIKVIVASGADVYWIEFGTGVYHNGSVGSSPNPYGAKLGMTIGGYGKGRGKQRTWGYYDENHNLVLTHGTPASMPMAKAITAICDEVYEIAKEVFA